MFKIGLDMYILRRILASSNPMTHRTVLVLIVDLEGRPHRALEYSMESLLGVLVRLNIGPAEEMVSNGY